MGEAFHMCGSFSAAAFWGLSKQSTVVFCVAKMFVMLKKSIIWILNGFSTLKSQKDEIDLFFSNFVDDRPLLSKW